MSGAPAAAFFDLDRTLITVNSGLLYAKWEHAAGRLSRRRLAQAMMWGALYHLDLIDIERAIASALLQYVGVPEVEVAANTAEWFRSEVVQHLAPGGADAIAWHQAAGRPCVLLTNSSSYAAEVATAEFGLDGWIANRFTVDGKGLLDGGFEAPLCVGAGKLLRAEKWAADNGFCLGESWFYSDALSDLAMLDGVGHPEVVNPDPRLRRLARRRGWPIRHWKAPK
ncbi:MAG: HAD-IB family hydrolase [Myxococcales bacterium]|nr:HAD-IB family hydrolase [Myxococcales bacterium]